jgi:hypothetical protein
MQAAVQHASVSEVVLLTEMTYNIIAMALEDEIYKSRRKEEIPKDNQFEFIDNIGNN